ncbi:unnamed protein product [Mytilus coruscus]|uniref:Uncharacterized protein n=1 Tax=Mytilus coruscus TaxID=42192 RepID=A0A6J8BRP7_MYTCO|nr:unnamed protein product [Mytilus coruscus]
MDVHRTYHGKGLPGPPNFPLQLSKVKDDLKGEDKDELLDLSNARFQCSINLSKDNMKSIIDKIAHKELIQKPKYAMGNMAITCRETFMGTFLSVDKLLEIYVNLEPTPRKFLKLLKASPITNAENASLSFFQQYVRGQNTVSLRKLLRFLTGSENRHIFYTAGRI